MNGADGYHDREVTDLEMTNAVLDGHRQHVVRLGGSFRTGSQHLLGTRMLGVVKRHDALIGIGVPHDSDEERYAAHRRVTYRSDHPVNAQRRVDDSRVAYGRWHASTLTQDDQPDPIAEPGCAVSDQTQPPNEKTSTDAYG